MISYSASSIKSNDKIQGVLVTKTVGNYSNGDLTFLNDGMVRFLINISQTFIGSKITFNMSYFEQGTLNNFINVTLADGQDHAMFMNLIQVKKWFLHVKSNIIISYFVNVLVEIIQFKNKLLNFH